MKNIKHYLKDLLLTDDEKVTLATQNLRMNMDKVIVYYFGNITENAASWNEKYLLNNVHINIDGIDLAWFEEVVIKKSNQQLEIGYFALNKRLVGQGIAKKMLLSLKCVCTSHLEVDKILFKERGQHHAYPSFYQDKIGATVQPSFPSGSGVDYLWDFSKAI